MKQAKTKYYSLQSFLSYLGRYKLRFVVVFSAFMVADILIALIPLFVGKLIGALAEQPIDSHQAYIYIGILLALSTGHDAVWHAGELLYLKLFNPIVFRYENIVFQQIIHKPYPYFVDKFTGKISSYITTLAKEFKEFLEKIFWDYADWVIRVVVVSAILISVNWLTGLIFVISLLFMFVVGRYTVRNSIKYEKVWTDVQSTKNGKIIDAIANFVNVKSFQKERLETRAIEHEQDKTIAAARQSYIWVVVFWASMGFIVRNVVWPAAIILNVYLYLHHQISLAELTTFLTSVMLFTNYVWNIIGDISQFTLKLARIEEAHQYLFGSTNIVKDYYQRLTPQLQQRALSQDLRFQALHFSYPDKPDARVLTNINLRIKKGEKVGIVGKSGSGKTTLTKLLLGYYPLDDKQILLDDQPVDTRKLATLVSYVPQDTSLFHRSIADNIAYATDRQVTRQAVVAASKQAHAHEFVAQLVNGYDTLVGERGVKLSAGQRQRIAIARAFLDDKPILVLDEATSALDSESEVLVQEALEALWHNKTVIAIAHRLSTLRNMDKIIVLDKGRIIEAGSHQTLLDKKGKYAKLWAHQSGGFLSEEDS